MHCWSKRRVFNGKTKKKIDACELRIHVNYLGEKGHIITK